MLCSHPTSVIARMIGWFEGGIDLLAYSATSQHRNNKDISLECQGLEIKQEVSCYIMHLTLQVIQDCKFCGFIQSHRTEREKKPLPHNSVMIL